MRLECTKKLLEYLNVKPVKMEEPVDPLFAWTANLITLNRRKTLVVINPVSRCIFVIYGLTAKLLPKLPELILEGVRTLLKSEYVDPEIIEKYLNDCGRIVTFSANTSRSAVANCNKACERVRMFTNLFIPGNLYQKIYLPWLNADLVPSADYMYTYEVMINMLKDRYGENVYSCRALELEVELELHTPCKRRLIVPEDVNFYQLHRILQDAFEWHDRHLHMFTVGRDHQGRPHMIIEPADPVNEPGELHGIAQMDSTSVTVGELFQKFKTVGYEYDFGDSWLHSVKLCRFIENCPEPCPRCTMAVGDAPMEDCGGADGFAQVTEILRDPSRPEHGEVSEWVRRSWWRPLDVDLINRRLRNAHRRCIPVRY